jgi:hypothetical protein
MDVYPMVGPGKALDEVIYEWFFLADFLFINFLLW